MRLDQVGFEADKSFNLVQIKRLFSELEVTCPFLPKNQMKRLLGLKGEFLVYKMQEAMKNPEKNLPSRLITEQVEIFVECKRKGIDINNLIGPKLLGLFRDAPSIAALQWGKEFEFLIPECAEFTKFHVDLLNILTEITLNNAIDCKRSMKQFSELITDAINLNVRSLALRPNVMGYFEFLKLTRLQCADTLNSTNDFEQAIDTCLLSLKNRINPNEDVRGKLQIIQLIVNETGNLEKGIKFAHELFINCDFSSCGSLIMEDLLCIIEDNHSIGSAVGKIITELLEKFSDQLRSSKKCQICVIETLLRLAEKNSTIKEDFQRAEEIFKVVQNLNSKETDEVKLKLKMIKCYIKLDKLSDAKAELDLITEDSINVLLLKLEAALRSQNEFDSFSFIEKILENSESRSENFLSLFNQLKTRIPTELKMKLLQAAKLCGPTGESVIDIERGIIGLLYDGILESGLTEEYKIELNKCLVQRKGI